MRPPQKKKRTPPVRTHEIPSLSAKKAELLEDLGRDPNEHPIFSLPSPFLPWGAAAGILAVGVLGPPLLKESPAGIVLAAAIILAFFVIMLVPRKLLIGRDGLLFVWILGSRFIRFRDIRNVDTSEGFFFKHPGINLELANGHAMDFATSVFKERWAERDKLILLLRVYVDGAKYRSAPAVLQTLLRAGKTHAAWARALMAMGLGAHFDPRAPAILHEDLWRIAENPEASLIQRTAAFVALSANRDPSTAKRLRSSLDGTVAPLVSAALRGALEAEGDEVRIATVLEQAEKSTPPTG